MTGARRILALVLLTGVFVLEGYDLNAMALAVPRLKDALGLEPAAFGSVFAVLPVGIGIGGAILAPLGDRLGRRPLIVFGCVGVAASMLGTSLSESIPAFLGWRLLNGIMLGACLPNVSALSADLAPDRLRATIMSVVSAGIPIGLAGAGLTTPAVVAIGGWQGLFVIPGLFGALLALALGYLLSRQHGILRLSASGTYDVARRLLLLAIGQRRAAFADLPQFELFRAPWVMPFAVFAAALAFNAINLYLINSWLPTVLPQAGFSLDDAARLSGVVQLAGLVIGVLASVLIDRWRPGLTLVAMFALIALSFLAIAATPQSNWTPLLLVGVGGASAGGMVLPALCAYLLPPRLLSSAVGMGVMIGRIGAFLGPLLGQAMLTAHVAPDLFLASAAGPAAVCALLSLAIPAALAVRRREEAVV